MLLNRDCHVKCSSDLLARAALNTMSVGGGNRIIVKVGKVGSYDFGHQVWLVVVGGGA